MCVIDQRTAWPGDGVVEQLGEVVDVGTGVALPPGLFVDEQIPADPDLAGQHEAVVLGFGTHTLLELRSTVAADAVVQRAK